MRDPQPVDHAVGEIEKIHAVLLAARHLTDENRPVDLAAIGQRLHALCRSIDAMPREAGQTLVPALETLAGELDKLGGELTARFGGLPTISDLVNAGDVSGAYGAAAKHYP